VPSPPSKSSYQRVSSFETAGTNRSGIPEERILFLNLLSAPEGIIAFKEEFPRLRIVTAFVDEGLDSRKFLPCCCESDFRFVVPGCGDFGDRFFGTDN
jgi:uracil phosphoribosyltransferase